MVAIAVIAGGDDGDRVTVPDVTGQKAADAVDAITSAGLKASTAGQVSTTVTKGIVISTSPSGGDEADAGSSVTVTVSQGTGTVAVPVLLGLSQADATAELTDAGLNARVLQASSDSVDKGAVISQDPAAGLQIDVGSTVAVTVSTGPAPVAVPDVSGRTVQEASQLLQQAGLVLGAVTQETKSGPPRGGDHRSGPRSVGAGPAGHGGGRDRGRGRGLDRPRLIRRGARLLAVGEGQLGVVADVGLDRVGHGVRAAPREGGRRCTSPRGRPRSPAPVAVDARHDPPAQVALR